MKKPVLAGIIFCAVILAVIIYSTMNLARQHVEVCMQYQGRTACGKAAGSTKDFALRKATSNACAQIASGVTDSTACERSDPASVTWK